VSPSIITFIINIPYDIIVDDDDDDDDDGDDDDDDANSKPHENERGNGTCSQSTLPYRTKNTNDLDLCVR